MEEEEEGRKVLRSLRGTLTRAKREMECAYLPTARPTEGRTTKGASRARGNDILLRARPSSVRPSVRGAVGPSTVGWMEVGARFT